MRVGSSAAWMVCLASSALAQADHREAPSGDAPDAGVDGAPTPAPSTLPAVATSPPTSLPSVPEKIWYGDWILLSDGISLLTLPVWVGIGGYFVAGPSIHLAHGNVGRAFASLALRVAIPAAALVAGLAVCRDGCNEGAAVLTALGVFMIPPVLDAALAYDEAPAKPASGVRAVPTVYGGAGRLMLGVTASF